MPAVSAYRTPPRSRPHDESESAAMLAGGYPTPRQPRDAAQIGRQENGAGAAAVAASGMGHLVQLNDEGGAELRHRSRQHHGAAGRVFLLHGDTVRSRESAYRGQVGSVGTMSFGKFITAQKGTSAKARCARGHCRVKILPSAP